MASVAHALPDSLALAARAAAAVAVAVARCDASRARVHKQPCARSHLTWTRPAGAVAPQQQQQGPYHIPQTSGPARVTAYGLFAFRDPENLHRDNALAFILFVTRAAPGRTLPTSAR